ncbi:helix-turn-helix transcriptional regulator [Vallitalea okinawensis]|uniref:helix-turn-helix transcriptional regulator n=1 Tax=Vallitalea okinawensis TaxID=2078660 RepID=UPI0014796F00|nr:YafY family protein [Vallitalea okinawensis]
MRIDRLLGIVIYLLNRDIVNANTLAEKFEVSSRTIQRDIEALCLAGIPIVSLHGTNGGYGIMDGFKLDKQMVTAEDYQFIKTALAGLCTAYSNKKLDETFEKIMSSSKFSLENSSNIKFDLSISREGTDMDDHLKIIEQAINDKHILKYEYTNAYGDRTRRKVEPIGMVYRWYAWYMLAYCLEKDDYRLFKVLRMRNLEDSENIFSRKHDDFETLLKKQEQLNSYNYIKVKIQGKQEVRVSVEEYFPNGNIIDLESGDFLLEFTVPEYEKGWKGLLFTYGNAIKIIEPDDLKREFVTKAQEIIDSY